MAHRRKAEDSVVFLLNKLDNFRSAANDLIAEEENVIDSVRSALTDLKEIVKQVKQLDAIKSNDKSLGERKHELGNKLTHLSFEIFHRFDKYTTVLQTPQHRPEGSSARRRHRSLLDTLSEVKDISKKYGELLDYPRLEKEGSGSNIDNQASEEGSATKRQYETGEGSSVTKSLPGDPVLIQGGDLVIFNRRKERLIQLLLEDNSRTKDVLVTGRGGSGRTALVKKVCEDVRVREHFGTIAWISAPQTYDPALIRREILLQLLLENKAPASDYLSAFGMHDGMLEAQVLALLQKTRHLIVVDNLDSPTTWEIFQEVLSQVKTGQVISIARHDRDLWFLPVYQQSRDFETYKLEDLSEEESWALFCLKTFPEGKVPSPLREVCQHLVRMCDGLPEVIVLFSHLLRNRKGRNDEWETMIPSSDLFHELDLIQTVQSIVYHDARLGKCLLYLSIFPENSLINCMRVSRLWTAEGFLDSELFYDQCEANFIFEELLARAYIHPVDTRSDGSLSTFRVNNLVREIIVFLSDHRNLLMIASEDSTKLPERVRLLSVQGTVKHLNEEKLSQLRSLVMFNFSSNKGKTTMSKASTSETSENRLFPFNAKLLQVLDLTGAPLQIAPDALFELTLLRYLSLRDTSIKVIPGSIGKLTQLEFLDLKHSLVTELPLEVEGLERIRHILIYHHEKDPLMENYNLIGFKASCRVGGFKYLEKLCFVEADDSVLENLGKLTNLRRLGITKLREEQGKLLCSSLEKLRELESLNVHAFDEDEIIDLCSLLSPPGHLKHLYLHGRLEKLPDWISSLSCLTKIILRWSQLGGDLLATLGKLPNLVELELGRAYNGRQVDFKSGQFPELKILLLDELEGLKSMSLEEGTMPSLEDLTISRCHWLKNIPSGIEHIRTIRKLEFFDMSREFYEKVRADREKDGYKKFEHIKEVYFRRWRAGHWETHQGESTDEAHCSQSGEKY